MRIFSASSEGVVASRLSPGIASFCNGPLTLANSETIRRTSSDGKQILICGRELAICTRQDEQLLQLSSLSRLHGYAAAWPVIFLIRDPIRVFDSWKYMGCTNVQHFTSYFIHYFRITQRADSNLIFYLLYERLLQQPHREIEKICSIWDIAFSNNMLELSAPPSPTSAEGSRAGDTNYFREPPGLSATTKGNSTIVGNIPCHRLVTNDEKAFIEMAVGRLYVDCWQDHTLKLRGILAEKQWIGLDLDDTLHEFRKASSIASNAVLEAIHAAYGVPLDALTSEYSEILRASTSNAFSDGKSSFEHRKDRFLLVAKRFSLPLDSDSPFVIQLLDLYERTLKESLELKSGAVELLRATKAAGKKIVVITEGPQDAQERTIENLGILPYVDVLATSSHFKVSKIDGLFTKVLSTLGITPSEIAYVGDSEHRDIIPANTEGIFAFHFDEDRDCNLEVYPPRINTLNKLAYILLGWSHVKVTTTT
ncbi:Haloacid dehalogenase-like hydrolase [Nemania abortiva]|nr:Haloacid dehalogenase-like hydrolase [Nemania abortiva]